MSEQIKLKKPTENNASPVWKNILIGVLTTVCVSAAVYFLGFNNKSSGSSKLDKQRSTVDAWKLLVTAENLAYRNAISIMMESGQFENFHEMLLEINTESLKFQSAVEQLMKKEDVDPDMITLLRRRLETEHKSLPYAEKLFAELDLVLDTAIKEDWEETKANEMIAKKLVEYGTQNQRMLDRSLTDIEELSKTLARRYSKEFSMNDFYAVQQKGNQRNIYDILNEDQTDSTALLATKEYFIGKWTPKHRKTTLSLNNDGKFRWDVPATPEEQISKGSWDIINKQLVLTDISRTDSATGGPLLYHFDISQVSTKSVSIQYNKSPYFFLTLQRQ